MEKNRWRRHNLCTVKNKTKKNLRAALYLRDHSMETGEQSDSSDWPRGSHDGDITDPEQVRCHHKLQTGEGKEGRVQCLHRPTSQVYERQVGGGARGGRMPGATPEPTLQRHVQGDKDNKATQTKAYTSHTTIYTQHNNVYIYSVGYRHCVK